MTPLQVLILMGSQNDAPVMQGAVDVLRFLGQAVPASGKIPHRRRFEMSTNLGERVEGVRLKHWLDGNSIKIYDKGSVLRVESTWRGQRHEFGGAIGQRG